MFFTILVKEEIKIMGKITAYKVNNLSKVDLRFYKDGDHFIAPRSVGMLCNGKMKILQSDLMTELNDLKNRVKALEEVRGRNLILNSGVPIEDSTTYNIVNYNLSKADLKHGEEITITIKAKLGENRKQFVFYNTQAVNEALLGFISKDDFDSNGIAKKAFRWVESDSNN